MVEKYWKRYLKQDGNRFSAPILFYHWKKFKYVVSQLVVGVYTFCIVHESVAQSGFNRHYDIGRLMRMYSIMYSQDHQLYLSGVLIGKESSVQNIYIGIIDTLGEIISVTTISDPNSNHLASNSESGIAMSVNQKVIVSFVYSGRPSFGLAILDPIGNLEYIREYPRDSGSVTSPRDIVELPDGYMITGWTSKPPLFRTDAFVLKTDKEGNFQWLREYGHPVHEENSRTITLLNSNLIVISGTRYQIENEPQFYHGWAYAIDSLGNKKWEWEANGNEIPHRGVMSMQYDTLHHEWVYVSLLEKPVFVLDLGREVDLSVPVLVRRDSNMQLLSYQEYGPYAYNGYMGALEKTRDGGWIAAGNITCLTEESPYNECNIESGRVLKLSNDGTLVWSVIDTAFFHPELGSRSYLSGVTESPSGSVYAVGWANNYDEDGIYRSFGWLLKITADGCVDTLCTTTSLLEQIQDREKKVKVYPNPAQHYMIVELHENICDPVDIELYDVMGQLFIREPLRNAMHVVSLDDDLNGMYAWRVVDARGMQIGSGKIFLE